MLLSSAELVEEAQRATAGSEASCCTRADVSLLAVYNMQNGWTVHSALCLRGGGDAMQRPLSFALLDRLAGLKLGDAA